MHDIRYATSSQKPRNPSRLIRRHERRTIARSRMFPVETLPLFAWRPRPPEVTPPSVPNESYAIAFLAKRCGISTSLARVFAELNNFGGEHR